MAALLFVVLIVKPRGTTPIVPTITMTAANDVSGFAPSEVQAIFRRRRHQPRRRPLTALG
jgi:hypothetical protein